MQWLKNTRKTWLSVALLSACISSSSIAQQSAYQPVELLENVSYSSLAELPVTAADKVISYGEQARQSIHLWYPPSEQLNTPLIVFIHGGCWLNVYDIEHTFAATSALQQQGYAVASIEYRGSTDGTPGYPMALNDINAALRAIAADQPQRTTGAAPVVLMGHSAGGHLALLAEAAELPVTAVVGLAAITDLPLYAQGDNSCQQAATQFIGAALTSETAMLYQEANPAAKSYAVPVYLLGSRTDRIIPANQMQALPAQTVWVEGANHFDFIHPRTKAWQQLLATLSELLANQQLENAP